jgi:hypothetical protein
MKRTGETKPFRSLNLIQLGFLILFDVEIINELLLSLQLQMVVESAARRIGLRWHYPLQIPLKLIELILHLNMEPPIGGL